MPVACQQKKPAKASFPHHCATSGAPCYLRGAAGIADHCRTAEEHGMHAAGTQAICEVFRIRSSTARAICTVPSQPEGALHAMKNVAAFRSAHHSGDRVVRPQEQSNAADIAGLFALRTHAALERDALVFRQALEAVGLDVLKVGEQIGATIVWSNETKSFGIIKPFYRAGLDTHVISFF
jgi:hypothetical protein